MKNNGCILCPRECGADRQKQIGFCGAASLPRIAKVMLHKWEEPCICYGNGSGAVFFSACPLRCVFCQNAEISRKAVGREMNERALADLFLQLEEKGACCIDLVSPTPYANTLIPALTLAKRGGLSIPVVYNCGGYEKASTLRMLQGLIDVYMPDFKFFDSSLSSSFSSAPDYAAQALSSMEEMLRQTGDLLWDGEHLKRGVMVRHLILPGHTDDSVAILEALSKHFPKEKIVLSLMRQFTPMPDSRSFEELTRRLTTIEYQKVLRKAKALGFEHIYTQKRDSASAEFIPDFSVFFEEDN